MYAMLMEEMGEHRHQYDNSIILGPSHSNRSADQIRVELLRNERHATQLQHDIPACGSVTRIAV